MSWCGLQGHDEVVDQFRQALKQGRLASTFLFVGAAGIGKATFARRLAQALQCEARPEEELAPCNACPSCQQCLAESHPDIQTIRKPDDKNFIPLDLLIGRKEHRNREGLCQWVSLKPAYGRRRIAVIEDADHLNQEGANCLLKTLEEPPPKSLLILIGTSEQRQLPTIRSRCQIMHFQPLDQAFIAEKLLNSGTVSDPKDAAYIAGFSDGSLERAIEWSDQALSEFREELWRTLASGSVDSIELAKRVQKFVDAAGKDAPPRRKRLRFVSQLLLVFLHEVIRQNELNGDGTHKIKIGHFPYDREHTLNQIERCIEAEFQVSANANVATLVECWMDDLFAAVN